AQYPALGATGRPIVEAGVGPLGVGALAGDDQHHPMPVCTAAHQETPQATMRRLLGQAVQIQHSVDRHLADGHLAQGAAVDLCRGGGAALRKRGSEYRRSGVRGRGAGIRVVGGPMPNAALLRARSSRSVAVGGYALLLLNLVE